MLQIPNIKSSKLEETIDILSSLNIEQLNQLKKKIKDYRQQNNSQHLLDDTYSLDETCTSDSSILLHQKNDSSHILNKEDNNVEIAFHKILQLNKEEMLQLKNRQVQKTSTES